MTTSRPGGLAPDDIEGIRSNLAAGRKPKVVFTAAAGQIAGEIGQVVRLTDPDSSDEWVVVRFGRDELPFAPADLALPPRGRAAATARTATGPAKADPAKANPAKTNPAKANPDKTNPDKTNPDKAGPDKTNPAKGRDKAGPDKPAPANAAPVPGPRPATDVPAASTLRPAKRATRGARTSRPKAPAALTVTLAYEAGEWTVAAHQGAKTLAKPYVVRAADALKMVSMLDVSGVHDAVEAIVTAELTEASQRADQLRNELAEVEARLADLRDAN